MFTIPSFIPCTLIDYFNHFKIAFTSDEDSEIKFNEKYEQNTLVYGYSCRSLFHIFIEDYMTKNPNAKVLCTPFNYKSHISIIEKYINSKNLFICELDNYNKIKQIENQPEEGFDLVIITHILGQDLNISSLDNLTKRPLIIEDRMMGGTLLTTQNNNVDLSFYSMEMDKLPNALGGGYVYIKNTHVSIIDSMENIIKQCERETLHSRIFTLLSIIPSYLVYNCTYILWIISFIISQLNKMFPSITMNKLITSYKKNNDNYTIMNYRPSNALVTSMKYNITRFRLNEKRYYYKFKMFYDCFTPEQQLEYFPWYNGKNYIKGYYNPIFFKNCNNLIKKLDNINIIAIKCPTYKLINIKDSSEYAIFLDNLVYLPSLQLMSYENIVKLAKIIKTTDH